jgi:hypothetical protein
MAKMEALAGIYRLICSLQWGLKSTQFHHANKSLDMVHESILHIGTNKTILRSANHKPLMVKFPNEHEWQNEFNLHNKEGLVSYTDRSNTNKGTGARVS